MVPLSPQLLYFSIGKYPSFTSLEPTSTSIEKLQGIGFFFVGFGLKSRLGGGRQLCFNLVSFGIQRCSISSAILRPLLKRQCVQRRELGHPTFSNYAGVLVSVEIRFVNYAFVIFNIDNGSFSRR